MTDKREPTLFFQVDGEGFWINLPLQNEALPSPGPPGSLIFLQSAQQNLQQSRIIPEMLSFQALLSVFFRQIRWFMDAFL